MGVHTKLTPNGIVGRLAFLSVVAALTLAACTVDELRRSPRSQAELIDARNAAEDEFADFRRDIALRGIARVKARYDDYVAGRSAEPPVIYLLVISGGGDWGAFGAGV